METGEWRKVPARTPVLWNLVQSSSNHASENPKLGHSHCPKISEHKKKKLSLESGKRLLYHITDDSDSNRGRRGH